MTELSLQKLQYQILGHNGLGFTEIRKIGEPTFSEFVKGEEEFDKTVQKYLDGNIYVGINPRESEKGDITTIKYLTCLVIDVDPVRPRGEPSTNAQFNESVTIAHKITTDFQGAIGIASGSGVHIYFPCVPTAVTNPDILSESLRNWFLAVKTKYETKTQKIDSIYDLPRVIRVWGSYNTKSSRPCKPIGEIKTSFRFDFKFNQADTPKLTAHIAPVQDAELNDRFSRLCLTNVVMRNIMQKVSEYSSRSEADFAFISCLVRAHFTKDDIKKLLPLNPLGKSSERTEKENEKEIKRVCDKIVKEGVETVSMLHDRDKYFDSLKDRKMGLRTGFNQFDEMVSGLKPTKVIVFAARPTEGKTTIATQILTNVAEQGKTCLFFPTEVGSEPIYDKIISRRTGISLKKFQNGNFSETDSERILSHREYLSRLPLCICEDFALTINKVEKKIKETAPQVVAIDYLQAMKYEGNTAGEIATEMGENVRRLKEMASVYKIPILLFSQLRRGDGKLDLSQLKGSGAIEELTDIISFLYCSDKLLYPRPTDLVVLKSKYSATGLIKLQFHSATCDFKEIGG